VFFFGNFFASSRAFDTFFVAPPLMITQKHTIVLESDENCFPVLENLSKTLETCDDIALIIINSPNNPTGNIYPSEMLKQMAEIIQKYPHIAVISDEVYRTIRFDGSTYSSIAHYLPLQTILIGGMSKEVSGTGLRVGFAAGPEHIIKAMAFINGHSCACVNLPTQKGYAAFLESDSDLRERLKIRQILSEKRDTVLRMFNDLPGLKKCKFGNPTGAFYVFPNIKSFIGLKTPTGNTITSDVDLSLYLLKSGQVSCFILK